MKGLRFERLELKYFVPEARVPEIRQFIEPYVRPDEYAAGLPGNRYTIHNVYLDTPRMDFFKANADGQLDRYKLRIRWYDEEAAGPFFLEVKRKVRSVVVKDRVYCTRAEVDTVLDGGIPPAASTLDRGDWRSFLGRMHATSAAPLINLRYTREAYESVFGEYARITFDRAICFQDAEGEVLAEDPEAWRYVDAPWATKGMSKATVLELKVTTGGVPRWMQDLVRRFGLKQVGFSKYATSIAHRIETSHRPFADHRFSWVGG